MRQYQNRIFYISMCLLVVSASFADIKVADASICRELTFYIEASGRTRLAIKSIADDIYEKISSQPGQVQCVFKYVSNVAGRGRTRTYTGSKLLGCVPASKVRREDIVKVLKWISRDGGGYEGIHTYLELLRSLATEKRYAYVYYSFLCPYENADSLKRNLDRVSAETGYYAGLIAENGKVDFKNLGFKGSASEYYAFGDLLKVRTTKTSTQDNRSSDRVFVAEQRSGAVAPPQKFEAIGDISGAGKHETETDTGSSIDEGESVHAAAGNSVLPGIVTDHPIDSGNKENLSKNKILNCQQLYIKYVESGLPYNGKGLFAYNATFCSPNVQVKVSKVLGNGAGYGSPWGKISISGNKYHKFHLEDSIREELLDVKFPVQLKILEYDEFEKIIPSQELTLFLDIMKDLEQE